MSYVKAKFELMLDSFLDVFKNIRNINLKTIQTAGIVAIVLLGLAQTGAIIFYGGKFVEAQIPFFQKPIPAKAVSLDVNLPGDLPALPEAKTKVRTGSRSSAPIQESSIPAPSYGGSFQWGVTMRPSALGYSADKWLGQIQKAKELGVGWARMNFDYGGGFARNDLFLEPVFANGLGVVMVIEHNPRLGEGNMYQDGLNDGKNIAGHYKGKISHYQMANEGGAQSIKSGTMEGIRTSDYDQGEYEKVRDYIRGVSDGISSVDSGATKIVTVSWMHTGFLDKLAEDGVKFDMIGIDWYSWMGSFGSRKISDTETLYHKLKSFGKPLTFMEANILPQASDASGKKKTVVDEQRQADFIISLGGWAWNNRNFVKGFFVLELVDNINVPGEYIDYYGLIKADPYEGSRVGQIGSPRQAFWAFKDLISGK